MKTDRMFLVLKGRRRGQPLTPAGLDKMVRGARDRQLFPTSLPSAAPHLLTRLREAGMALEAVQAQAGPSLDRVDSLYSISRERLAFGEYMRALESIVAQTVEENA